jgi:hypothetical protein
MRTPLRLALGLLLLGCTEPKPRPRLADVMPTIPLPPGAEVLASEGGEDALKIRLRSPAPPEPLATYYRDLLSQKPWRLVSDTRMADGGIALYAEQDNGPPLWVTIKKAEGAQGTLVDLAGAKAR